MENNPKKRNGRIKRKLTSVKNKLKQVKENFKTGYSHTRRPLKRKLMSAAETTATIGGAALSTGPAGAATALGFTGWQVYDMAKTKQKLKTKTGRLGKKIGSKVLSFKQRAALKRAQRASANARKKSSR